jgi:hypothetical protein
MIQKRFIATPQPGETKCSGSFSDFAEVVATAAVLPTCAAFCAPRISHIAHACPASEQASI